MANDKWLNNIARIIKKSDGGHFLVFERRQDKDGAYIGDEVFPLTINEGDIFQMRKKEDDLAKLVEDGKLSQETADKICKHVRFEISKAPDSKDKPEGKKAGKKSKKSSGEVDF